MFVFLVVYCLPFPPAKFEILKKDARAPPPKRDDPRYNGDYMAFRKGKVKGAKGELDTLANLQNVGSNTVLPWLFLLPHLGSATVETRNAMGFRALDNIDAFVAGKDVPFTV